MHESVDGHDDRLPHSRMVTTFRETASGPMPDTPEWAAIKGGSVRHAKTFPGAGTVQFIAYQLGAEAKYAIVRILSKGFDVPAQHGRFIVEAFGDYEVAASAYPLAVGWLGQLVELYGAGLLDSADLESEIADFLAMDAGPSRGARSSRS